MCRDDRQLFGKQSAVQGLLATTIAGISSGLTSVSLSLRGIVEFETYKIRPTALGFPPKGDSPVRFLQAP